MTGGQKEEEEFAGSKVVSACVTGKSGWSDTLGMWVRNCPDNTAHSFLERVQPRATSLVRIV